MYYQAILLAHVQANSVSVSSSSNAGSVVCPDFQVYYAAETGAVSCNTGVHSLCSSPKHDVKRAWDMKVYA